MSIDLTATRSRFVPDFARDADDGYGYDGDGKSDNERNLRCMAIIAMRERDLDAWSAFASRIHSATAVRVYTDPKTGRKRIAQPSDGKFSVRVELALFDADGDHLCMWDRAGAYYPDAASRDDVVGAVRRWIAYWMDRQRDGIEAIRTVVAERGV